MLSMKITFTAKTEAYIPHQRVKWLIDSMIQYGLLVFDDREVEARFGIRKTRSQNLRTWVRAPWSEANYEEQPTDRHMWNKYCTLSNDTLRRSQEFVKALQDLRMNFKLSLVHFEDRVEIHGVELSIFPTMTASPFYGFPSSNTYGGSTVDKAGERTKRENFFQASIRRNPVIETALLLFDQRPDEHRYKNENETFDKKWRQTVGQARMILKDPTPLKKFPLLPFEVTSRTLSDGSGLEKASLTVPAVVYMTESARIYDLVEA